MEIQPILGMGQEIKELPEINMKKTLPEKNMTDWWQYIKRDKKMQESNESVSNGQSENHFSKKFIKNRLFI